MFCGTKVFVENDDRLNAMLFSARGAEVVHSPVKASLIVFSGGVDVNPKLYGEERDSFTSSPNTARDANCVQLWKFAKKNGVPVVGICRGAQFLSVMLGGKLIQHIPGHSAVTFHDARKQDGPPESWGINSYHHQGILNHEGISAIHSYKNIPWGRVGVEEFEWIETFTCKSHPMFCVQWHPEFYAWARCQEYFLNEVQKLTKRG